MSYAEEILIKLGVDANSIDRDLHKITEKVSEWGKEQAKLLSGAALGYAGVEGIKAAYEATVEYSEKIIDLSKRLDVSTDAVQVWDFALRKNGGTIEQAAGFFEKLGVAREKALAGGEEGNKMVNYFKQLGISVDDLKNKRIEDIAEQIGDVFKNGGDAQQLIGALREVGGKSAGEMIATLKEGIAEAREEAEKLGIVLSKGTLSELKEAGDQMKIIGNEITAALAPVFAWIADKLSEVKAGALATFAGIYAAVQVLLEHPTDFKGAKDAFVRVGSEVAHEYFEERDKRRAKANEPAKTGGSSGDASIEIDKANKKAQELEDKANSKSLSAAEKVAKLQLERNRLQEKYDEGEGTELDRAEQRVKLAQNGLDLQEAMNEKKKEEAEHTKKIAEQQKKITDEKHKLSLLQRDRKESDSAYLSIDQLASSGMRYGAGGYNTREAQRIKFLESDEALARAKGNTDFADNEKAERLRLTADLAGRGIIKPDHHLESIDDNITKLRDELIQQGVKLKDDE